MCGDKDSWDICTNSSPVHSILTEAYNDLQKSHVTCDKYSSKYLQIAGESMLSVSSRTNQSDWSLHITYLVIEIQSKWPVVDISLI